MDEFQSRLLSAKRNSKYSYLKMMEYWENKSKKELPVDIVVQEDCAVKLAENKRLFQELLASELAKAQDNIQKSMESQISTLMALSMNHCLSQANMISELTEVQKNTKKSLEDQISALQTLVQEKAYL